MATRAALVALLCVICALICSANGAEYFISPSGSDSNSGTSSSSPLLTLSQALSVSAVGDTINAAEGTYSGSDNVGLTVSFRTIVGASTGGTVFQATGVGLFLNTNTTVDTLTMSGGSMALSLTGGSATVRNVAFAGAQTAIHLGAQCTVVTIEGATFASSVQYGVVFTDNSQYLWQSILIDRCSFDVRTSGLQIYASASGSKPNFVDFTVRDCDFVGAYNAVHWQEGPATTEFSGCHFANMTVGSAISLAGGQAFAISNCTFTNNHAGSNSGGAVFYQQAIGQEGELRVEGSVFSGNSGSTGGAIYHFGSKLIVTDSAFLDNTVTNYGGAIFIYKVGYAGVASFTNSLFLANTAQVAGGAVYSVQDLIVTNFTACALAYNSCGSGGGGAFTALGGEHSMSHVVLLDNAAKNGGALYISSSGSVDLDSVTFVGNNATNGGAIYVDEDAVALTCANSTFSDNSANYNGGAVFTGATEGLTSFQDSSFKNNTASTGGGLAVGSDQDVAMLDGVTFEGNVAYTSGGGLYCSGGEVDLEDVSFSGNSAGEGSAYTCEGACDISSEDVYVATDNSVAGCGEGADWETPRDMAAELVQRFAQVPRATRTEAIELLVRLY